VKAVTTGTPHAPTPAEPTARPDAPHEAKKVGEEVVVKEAPARPETQPLPTAASAPDAVVKPEPKAVLEPKPTDLGPPAPIADAPRPKGPTIAAFDLPDLPKSQFGGPIRQDCDLVLPQEGDRFEIVNAPGLRVTPPGGSQPWQIATKAGTSLLDRPATLAQLAQKDARTWRFEWTKEAIKYPSRAEALRDAVFKFPARDGRVLYALLRPVEPRDNRPLPIVASQPLLFDRLEPRTRPVVWTRDPDALSGTKWKLSIRRWRVTIARPDAEKIPARRVFDSAPDEPGKGPGPPGAKGERDLIPDEVTLKLSIDPESPDTITVRFVPDRDRALEGRKERAARRKTLEDDTPEDKEGRPRDPVDYRRDRLRLLEAADKKDERAIKALKDEIRELREMEEIRQLEELLAKPVRAELSVVIGLEVDESNILEIARIGEFAQ
jgi:hypothetical protein